MTKINSGEYNENTRKHLSRGVTLTAKSSVRALVQVPALLATQIVVGKTLPFTGKVFFYPDRKYNFRLDKGNIGLLFRQRLGASRVFFILKESICFFQ
ncbi:hypothetical protein [Sporomusa aerivorans]|uniref:hypothetical protein n=1 Tax=Sporomusa aerivorans TaxID=204936 RepID=UPI00352B8D5C